MSLIPSTKPKPKDQSEEEKIEEGIVDLTIDTNCLNDDNYLGDDDHEPICMSCNREIDYKSDIFYISGFKYHLSCIKCASCGKEAESIDDIDNFFFINPRTFLCSEHYKSFQDGENDFDFLHENNGFFLNALFKPKFFFF